MTTLLIVEGLLCCTVIYVLFMDDEKMLMHRFAKWFSRTYLRMSKPEELTEMEEETDNETIPSV